jgi:hypothetical protein
MTRFWFFSPRAAVVLGVIGLVTLANPVRAAGREPEETIVAATPSPSVRISLEGDESPAWFPESADLDLTIRPPVQLAQVAAEPTDGLPREQALIPLPPAAWTGLAGLAVLAVPGCRRILERIVR